MHRAPFSATLATRGRALLPALLLRREPATIGAGPRPATAQPAGAGGQPASTPPAPGAPRRRLPRKALIAAGVAGAFAVLLWALAWFGPIAHPRTVQVGGATGPDAARITEALRDAGSEQSTFAVDHGELIDAVRQYPDVADVKLQPRPPFRLDLTVVMRPAVARVELAGQQLVVAGDGTILRRAGKSSIPRIDPSVTGLRRRGDRVLAPGGALAVLGAAPAPLLELAETLQLGESGLEIEFARGPRLIFGDGDLAAEKWAAASAVLAEGAALRATYVDVRVPARPAAGGLEMSALSQSTGTADAPPTLGAPSTGEAAATTTAQTPAPTPQAEPPAGTTDSSPTGVAPAAEPGSQQPTAPQPATGGTAPVAGGATP